MKTLLIKIKEYWEVFVKLTKSSGFIFTYPSIAIALLALTPPRFLGFLLLIVWVIVVINNTDDEKL
jgi:hypothetical protein